MKRMTVAAGLCLVALTAACGAETAGTPSKTAGAVPAAAAAVSGGEVSRGPVETSPVETTAAETEDAETEGAETAGAEASPAQSEGAEATDAVTSPAESESAGPAGAEASPAAGVIEIPAAAQLPIKTLPLMPGATAERSDVFAEDEPSQSFKIQMDGKSGKEISDWYYQAMKDAGYKVSSRYDNGGFQWEGKGVSGDSACTTSSYIIGMHK